MDAIFEPSAIRLAHFKVAIVIPTKRKMGNVVDIFE